MKTFENQGLSPEILRAISDLGFTEPTPIQEKVIPAILKDSRDIIGLAQTGTGKTAGFGLPIIQQIDTEARAVQAVILCPTRELCLQITNDLKSYAKYQDSISIVAVYGGAHIVNQIKDIKRGVQIIVGTPGRTLDLIKRKVLKIDSIRWMVLDEADEMLNMGFRDELDAILEATPEEKQVLLFSATMPAGVRQIAENYMHQPVEIVAGKRNTGAENVVHHVYHVKSMNRFPALKRLIDVHEDMYGIVFCRTRNETRELADKLTKEGYNADALHGDLSQAQRDQVMKRFRNRNLQLLVATDVAARGLDVNDLTHVINYTLPDDPEVYIHRSGRTGRAGKTGISVTMVSPRDGHSIHKLEKLTGKSFQKQMVPEGKDIFENKLQNLIGKIENADGEDKRIDPFLPVIFEKFRDLDREELIKKIISMEFNSFLEEYQHSENLNAREEGGSRGDNHRNSKEFDRFHINLGRKHNLNPNRLMGLVNECVNNKNISIGKIEIQNNFSFFEIEKESSSQVIKAMERAVFDDVPVKIQPAEPKNENKNGTFNKFIKNKKSNYREKKRFSSDKNQRKKFKNKRKVWAD